MELENAARPRPPAGDSRRSSPNHPSWETFVHPLPFSAPLLAWQTTRRCPAAETGETPPATPARLADSVSPNPAARNTHASHCNVLRPRCALSRADAPSLRTRSRSPARRVAPRTQSPRKTPRLHHRSQPPASPRPSAHCAPRPRQVETENLASSRTLCRTPQHPLPVIPRGATSRRRHPPVPPSAALKPRS